MHQEYDLVTPLLFWQNINFAKFSHEETSVGFNHSIFLDLIAVDYHTRDVSDKLILSIPEQSFYPASLSPFLCQMS